jgi:hypothetical protein
MPASAAYLPDIPSLHAPDARRIDNTAIAGPSEPVMNPAVPETAGKNKAPHPATPLRTRVVWRPFYVSEL